MLFSQGPLQPGQPGGPFSFQSPGEGPRAAVWWECVGWAGLGWGSLAYLGPWLCWSARSWGRGSQGETPELPRRGVHGWLRVTPTGAQDLGSGLPGVGTRSPALHTQRAAGDPYHVISKCGQRCWEGEQPWAVGVATLLIPAAQEPRLAALSRDLPAGDTQPPVCPTTQTSCLLPIW